MADFGVYLRRITQVRPVPDSDRLDVVTVSGFECVVGRDTYSVGDTVLYIPEGAILPDELITRMGLEGRLAGKAKNRVKAVKLRGVLSQGLVYAVDSLMFREEVDHAERLGIVKYEPEIPASFSGQAFDASDRIEPWVEVNAVKNMRSFDPETGLWTDPFHLRQVEATLKVHGTAFVCTYSAEAQELYVSSKGFGKRGVALAEDPTNVYWRAVHAYGIKERLASLCRTLDRDTVSLYGEVYGPGIQDLTYGRKTLSFCAFDLRLNGRWVNPATARNVCAELDVPFVPAVYIGPYDYDRLVDIAETLPEDVAGFVSRPQEGIVIRTTGTGARVMGKIVSSQYATRKGGTEYT